VVTHIAFLETHIEYAPIKSGLTNRSAWEICLPYFSWV